MDAQSIPDMSALGASLPAPQSSTKPQRVLACMLCHQRKVKCDHKFPCANCIRAGAQCVPGTMARRQQRRSPPKKELLERLRNSEDLVRKYEDLLRENNVKFGPDSRIPSAEKPSPHGQGQGSDDSDDGDGQQPESVGPDRSPSATVQSESAYEATYALSKRFLYLLTRLMTLLGTFGMPCAKGYDYTACELNSH